MKKLLCLFLNTTIFCSIYAGPETELLFTSKQLPFNPGSFPKATIELCYQYPDQNPVVRPLTPADLPMCLKPNGTAEFVNPNNDALFNKGLWIGLAAGVGGTLMLFWVASYFFGNKTNNSVKEQSK